MKSPQHLPSIVAAVAAAITTATTTTTTTIKITTAAAVVLGKEKATEEEMQSNTRSWKRMGIERKFIHIERMAGKRNHPQICTNLHMKDSQSTQKNIEMKFREFLEKVQAPLNEIVASNDKFNNN